MSDKIYLISTGEYSDYRPLFYANSREEAEEFCIRYEQSKGKVGKETYADGVFIEELNHCGSVKELNDLPVVCYKCDFYSYEGEIKRGSRELEAIVVNDGVYDSVSIKDVSGYNRYEVTIRQNKFIDEEKVWKIAQDYLYQYLYQKG